LTRQNNILELCHKTNKEPSDLVESNWGSHGALDVERSDVLPLLLQQGHQEIDGHVDVLDELIIAHLHVTDGDGQAENLLHLELDGGFHLANLGVHVVASGEDRWKLTSLVETRSEQTRDLSNERVGSEEGVVLFGKLLHELLVLVELFEVFDRHAWDAVLVGLIDMRLVTEDTYGELGSSNVGKLDGTAETLVLLGIVVLEHDL